MTSRPSTAAPILAVLAIVLVTLGAYVASYLWLGEVSCDYSPAPMQIERNYYPRLWARNIFQPAAKVESWLRGIDVKAVHGPPYTPYTEPTTPFFEERYE